MKRLTPIEAREELLFRFHRIIQTLVSACQSGRPNYFSSYALTFLRLFAGKSVSLEQMAGKLKKELSIYTKEELMGVGQAAVLLAIEKTETNLVSTIVGCFKDLIYSLTKNQDLDKYVPITPELNISAPSFEEEIVLNLFIESLSEKDQKIVVRILAGEYRGRVPDNLKHKIADYLGLDLL